MKGYPKFLNTKADYEYVRTHFPREKWEQDFKNLISTQYYWKDVKQLDSADGQTDDTHRVLTMDDENDGKVYIQQELTYNEKCKMARVGYTEEEVKAIVGDNQ